MIETAPLHIPDGSVSSTYCTYVHRGATDATLGE